MPKDIGSALSMAMALVYKKESFYSLKIITGKGVDTFSSSH